MLFARIPHVQCCDLGGGSAAARKRIGIQTSVPHKSGKRFPPENARADLHA